MMATPRYGSCWIWPTWITGLLSGDKQCHFAAWYRSHYKYDKRQDSTFDSAAWTAQHNALVISRKDELEADGWTVTLEGQNDFKLKGKSAVLSGKPDIIATRNGQTLVVDCKTGKKRNSDWFQVLLYILALRRLRPELKAIGGEVCYSDGPVPVHPEDLTPEREEQIFAMLRLVGGDERPAHVPSKFECSFCDVAECTERWTAPDKEPETVAAEF
jgi:hypothetical protein